MQHPPGQFCHVAVFHQHISLSWFFHPFWGLGKWVPHAHLLSLIVIYCLLRLLSKLLGPSFDAVLLLLECYTQNMFVDLFLHHVGWCPAIEVDVCGAFSVLPISEITLVVHVLVLCVMAPWVLPLNGRAGRASSSSSLSLLLSELESLSLSLRTMSSDTETLSLSLSSSENWILTFFALGQLIASRSLQEHLDPYDIVCIPYNIIMSPSR